MPIPHFDYFQYMVKIQNFRGNVKTEGIGPDGGIFGGHWNSPDHSKYFHIDIPCASVGKMCVQLYTLLSWKREISNKLGICHESHKSGSCKMS